MNEWIDRRTLERAAVRSPNDEDGLLTCPAPSQELGCLRFWVLPENWYSGRNSSGVPNLGALVFSVFTEIHIRYFFQMTEVGIKYDTFTNGWAILHPNPVFRTKFFMGTGFRVKDGITPYLLNRKVLAPPVFSVLTVSPF